VGIAKDQDLKGVTPNMIATYLRANNYKAKLTEVFWGALEQYAKEFREKEGKNDDQIL
jgi:hypothetical protein